MVRTRYADGGGGSAFRVERSSWSRLLMVISGGCRGDIYRAEAGACVWTSDAVADRRAFEPWWWRDQVAGQAVVSAVGTPGQALKGAEKPRWSEQGQVWTCVGRQELQEGRSASIASLAYLHQQGQDEEVTAAGQKGIHSPYQITPELMMVPLAEQKCECRSKLDRQAPRAMKITVVAVGPKVIQKR
jgi:hypothetical protein